MPPRDEYDVIIDPTPCFNIGNCKRCVNKSSCGNKNKREADWYFCGKKEKGQ